MSAVLLAVRLEGGRTRVSSHASERLARRALARAHKREAVGWFLIDDGDVARFCAGNRIGVVEAPSRRFREANTRHLKQGVLPGLEVA